MLSNKSSAVLPSGTSGGTNGTASAPLLAGTRASKGPRQNVRDLGKGGDKEATAKDMLEGLEKNVRRMLSTKQKEYDRIVYDLKHRKMELEKLKLDYKDVTIDKSALGIPTDNAAPKDRLQVVKTVFTTPFFTKDEKINAKLGEVEEKRHQTELAIANGQVYEFMRDRVNAEVVDVKKRLQKLNYDLVSVRSRHHELNRDAISAGESLGKAQKSLAEVRAVVEEELALWRKEIKSKSGVAKQKENFESFLASNEAAQQRQLELERSRIVDAASAAKTTPDVEMSLRMGEATLSIAEELSKYEMMFRRIGVDPEGATAEQVLAACRSQDDVRVEVTRKRNAEEERVAFLQKQLLESKRVLQSVLDDENRTTSRALSKAETDLAAVEAQLATDRQEYAYIQKSLQSIKIGMNRLSLKILGEESVDMATPQGCTDTLSKLHARLGAVIEDTKSVALDAGEIIELPPAVLTLSATGEAIAPIHAPYMTEAVSKWLLSTNNVRVGNVDTSRGAPRRASSGSARKGEYHVTIDPPSSQDTGRLTAVTQEDSGSDGDDDLMELFDRKEIKKLSANIAARLSKTAAKQKAPGKDKK